METFTTEELRIVARTLNLLHKDSDTTKGVIMNTAHFTRFYNDTHYIDFQTRLRKFRVYVMYKGFKRPKEVFPV